MKKEALFNEIIQALSQYVQNEDFKGYDPYDTLNSWFPFHIFGGRYGQILAMQFQVRNPINLRSLLGVKKEYSAKGLALFLQAYSILYRINPSEEIKKILDDLFNWFIENRRKDFEGYCWAVHYPIAWSVRSRPKFDPSAVLACVVAEGIFEYYLTTKNKKAVEVLEGISIFLLNHIPITENEHGKCYSYTTTKKEVVFNANTYVAETFAKTYYINKDEKLKEEALKCIDFNLAYQKDDGRWVYRLYPETGVERNQIDFHQGFILNSLYDSIKYLELKDKKYTDALKKGLDYYIHQQFTNDGRGFWRVPSLYPIDIHNQDIRKSIS